jgi:protease-4
MEKRTAFRSLLTAASVILLFIVLPLVVGYFLALYFVPTPQVAVIRIEGDIWDFYAAYISQALEDAGNDPAVSAVVLDIVSPGGEVTASEGLYFDVLKLRERKPVIASLGQLAASGAYYVASATDRIYAMPASEVGNIGVISFLPDEDLVDEEIITTGPFKFSGGSQMAYIRQLGILKDAFLAAIMAQRADRLTVSAKVLSRGEIYFGVQAQKMGLIDEIGSQTEAVAAAAQMAGVRHYKVVDRTPELSEDEYWFGYKLQRGSTAATVAAMPRYLPPGFYYRYVDPLR